MSSGQRLSVSYLLVSSCVLLLMSFGLRSGFGLFVQPISEANQWGREVISISLATQNLVWGLVSVFAGGLADRFGNVRVIIGGTILYALGLWLMAGVDSPWLLHSSAGVLIGAGIAGTTFGIVLPAMARAVGPEKRQWALGVGTAAGSMGQFVMVPITLGLMDSFGWVLALQIMAAGSLFMALLAMPLAPYSGASEASAKNVPAQSVAQALREAIGHTSYCLLVTGFFVCGFHIAFITVHMPAFLVDKGFDASLGAWSIALIGICNVVGAYSSGVLSSIFPRRHLLVWIYLGRSVAITIFMLVPLSVPVVLLFSAAMGFLWLATIPPTSGLVALMFGTRYMALLYGVVFLGHQLGSFSGVWLGGWLFDHYGTYDLVWWTGVLLGALAAVLHWPIKEKPLGRLAIEGG